jgi:hypothetical protein
MQTDTLWPGVGFPGQAFGLLVDTRILTLFGAIARAGTKQ